MNPSERLCEQLSVKCMYSLLEAKLGTGDVLLFHGFANGSRPIPFFRSWRPQFNVCQAARQDTPETAQKTLATPEITTLLTIYALIGDDMRLIFSEKPADEVFNVITAATMVVFGLEVIINTFGKQGFLDPIDHLTSQFL